MNSSYDKIIAEFNKDKKYKFIGYYSGYATSLSGDDVISAIRYFNSHYNASLSLIVEFDLNTNTPIRIFKTKLNDSPDVRGNYNYSYYTNKDEFVFNEDTDTRPIVILKPSIITPTSHHGYIDRDGNFFECNYECHKYLAKELFLSKTIPEATEIELNKNFDEESILDSRGWAKISSKRIHYLQYKETGQRNNLTERQKQTIINIMETLGLESYEFCYHRMSKDEIIEELKNN